MSTRNQSFIAELNTCNDCLDQILRAHFGMTVKTYKLIKATTQLAAVGAGIYAIAQGADPTLTFATIGAIISGPEVAELILTNADARKE